MARTLVTLCLVGLFGAGLSLSAMAQTGCPPGQTFIPNLNLCIASSGAPNCPPGTHYAVDLRRCLGVLQPACPEGQGFDEQQKACVPKQH